MLTDGQETVDIVDIGKGIKFILHNFEWMFCSLLSMNRDMKQDFCGICSSNYQYVFTVMI